MNKLFKYIFLIISHGIFYIVTFFVPKKKNLWVFGCWEGKIYADNAKYFFEWTIRNHPEIKCVWITRNKDVFKKLKDNGFSVVLFPSFQALCVLSCAKVAVETEGNVDIGGYRPGRITIIQLWHGVAPKKMNWRKKYNSLEQHIINLIYDNHKKSYWMVSSEQNRKIMKKFFDLADDHIFVTGYPRNDVLINSNKNEVINKLHLSYPDCKTLIYMPTHRGFGKTNSPAFSKEEMIKLNERLRENKLVLLFKPHLHELHNYLSQENILDYIIFAKGEDIYNDVYSYVGSFDLLICDYSSIEYDFLCTKKPIVIFPYDLEEFRKSDGLFDYFEEMPCGPFCYTWEEVIDECKALTQDDSWEKEREKCRIMFHPFDDGQNSRRVYDAIQKII